MLVLYDKTLIAPAKLIALAETIARSQGILLQKTCSATAERTAGRSISPALACRLLCLVPYPTRALRGIHCRRKKDIHHTQQLLVALVAGMNRETVDHLTDFRC